MKTATTQTPAKFHHSAPAIVHRSPYAPFRQSRPVTAQTSPLARYDGSREVRDLSRMFALRPADQRHVANRLLALAIASADGRNVRVIRGRLQRQHRGEQWTLLDSDGFTIGRSLTPNQILGWTGESEGELEASALRALRRLAERRLALVGRQIAADAAARASSRPTELLVAA